MKSGKIGVAVALAIVFCLAFAACGGGADNGNKTPDTYTITYALDGGTNSASNPSSYTAESAAITLQAPTKAGYTFTGWTEGSTIPAGSTGNKTFTATWTATAYTITYALNGGTNNASNPTTYTVESALITLQAPTKAGYTFTGWTEGSTIPAGSTGNKTFTATWSAAITYTITYALNGGTNNASNPTTYTVESALITLQAPTKAGYTFVSWTEGNTIPAGSTGNKTFTATWSAAVTYTITYALNGGTNNASNPTTYTVESAAITLQAPTRAGYTFTGWTEGSTIPAGSTGNKTFTATWSAAITYTITYALNGGTNNASNPSSYTVESALITLQAPTRAGYTFAGWTEGSTIPAGSTGNKTFTATWSAAVTYTITYALSGGTNNAGNPTTYTVESALITLQAPTKAGYTFVSWTEGNTIPAGSTGNKTFTATWSAAVTYTITYALDGGTNNASNPTTYTVESAAITLQAPTKAGYTFTGWTEGSTIPAGSTGNKTFTATWSAAVTYTITYNLSGGTNNVSNPTSYTVESALITLQAPTKAGYTFVSWTEGNTIPAGSTGNKTFTAAWSAAITYTITYALDGGTNNASNPTTYTVESATITLQAPTKAGYTFTGWTEGSTIPAGSTGNKTFTATWSAAITYTITYALDGGTNNASNPTTYTVESATITLQAPTKAGYTFTGWTEGSTVPAGSTGNKTFTATWDAIPVNYKITYTFNDGRTPAAEVVTAAADGTFTAIADPVRGGYRFDGWYTSATGGEAFTETTLTADTVVYAHWSAAITYTITYLDQGGTAFSGEHGAESATVHIDGIATTLVSPTKAGFAFGGWFTAIDCSGAAITGLPATGIGANIVLYAKWSQLYKITYNLNYGETPETIDRYANEAGAFMLIETPVRPGFIFGGWFKEADLTTEFTDDILTGDITVYAKWTEPSEGSMFIFDEDGVLTGLTALGMEQETLTLVFGGGEGEIMAIAAGAFDGADNLRIIIIAAGPNDIIMLIGDAIPSWVEKIIFQDLETLKTYLHASEGWEQLDIGRMVYLDGGGDEQFLIISANGEYYIDANGCLVDLTAAGAEASGITLSYDEVKTIAADAFLYAVSLEIINITDTDPSGVIGLEAPDFHYSVSFANYSMLRAYAVSAEWDMFSSGFKLGGAEEAGEFWVASGAIVGLTTAGEEAAGNMLTIDASSIGAISAGAFADIVIAKILISNVQPGAKIELEASAVFEKVGVISFENAAAKDAYVGDPVWAELAEKMTIEGTGG